MALRDHPLLQKRLTKQEQLHFAQHLLALLHAGLPLLNAIELLYQSAPKPWLGWLMRIHTLLKKGYSLSHCLREQGGQFSMEFINLIRVSERSGDLSLALKTISQQLTEQIELRRKIQQALSYPIITLSTSFGLVIVMMVWVVPVFKDVFGHFQAELPAPTRALIAVSTLIEHFYIELLIGMTVLLGIFIAAWLKSPRLQKGCDRMTLHSGIGEFI